MVLNTLESKFIPGLEATEWTSLSPEQQDLALNVARRALEARGLAQFDAQGQLLVHRALLTAVGLCAYPRRMTVVEYWKPGAASQTFYAHTQGQDSVVHTVERGFHTFVLLPSEAALIDHVAATCNLNDAPTASPLELTLAREDFTRVCDAAATGAEAEALQLLTAAKQPTEAASALVHALAGGPHISIVLMLQPGDGEAVPEQSFTLIKDDRAAWIVAAVSNEATAPLKARTVSSTEIATTLLRGL